MRVLALKTLRIIFQFSSGQAVHRKTQPIASLFNYLSTLTSMSNSDSLTISLFI
mgnify:FL=1